MSEDTFRWVITGGVAISTLCIFALAIVAVVLSRVVGRVQARIDGVAERVEPIIDTVRRLADENAPKISAMTTSAVDVAANVKDISEVAKDQTHRFAQVAGDFANIAGDVADRTQARVAQVDACVDEAVDHARHAGRNAKVAVMKPVREAGAVLAGVKAAVSFYANGRRPSIDHITQDEEMFI